MSKSVATVSAAAVREFYLADPKRLARLSEAGQASVRKTRGRLHTDVVKAYNKGRKSRLYVVGEARAAEQAKRAASAKRRADLRASGVAVKDRGRLPKVTLGQPKG